MVDCETLEATCAEKGPLAALDSLENHLRESRDYSGWFYTLLMRSRYKLDLPPTPTAPAEEIIEAHQEVYEESIRQAGRTVGQAALQNGQLDAAWQFYKLLGEPEPVRQALLARLPGENDDWEVPIRLAFYEGLAPELGFEWVLARYGLCNAITTLSQETPGGPAVRQHCLRAMVRALRDELWQRLHADLRHREHAANAPVPVEGDPENGGDAAYETVPFVKAPPAGPGDLPRLLDQHPELTVEDSYHIDLSHLQSTVQFAAQLETCPERTLARELCDYGKRLKGRFVPHGEPPFEGFFTGWDHFLAAMEGDDLPLRLAYFQGHAEKAAGEGNPYPAEIWLDLLKKLGRDREALQAAAICQSASALRGPCRELKDFRPMREAARRQKDPVHFLAAILEQRALAPRAR